MDVYITGSGGLKSYLDIQIKYNPPRLFSYFGISVKDTQYGESERFKDFLLLMGGKKMVGKLIKLFLDSGAYSAWSKGVPIDIQEYIQFIKLHLRFIAAYSVLDVMGDPEKTWANQRIMEKAGLHPVPCFHYNDDEKYVKLYTSGKYPYISFGGMVPEHGNSLVMWLDRMFRDYVCGPDGMPKCKVHGFGMTTHDLLWRYPWYSVDSASWVFAGRNGVILVPRKINGEYNYQERAWTVTVSDKSGEAKKTEGKHFNSFSKTEQKQIVDYLAHKGEALGESTFFTPSGPDYVLKADELWANAKTKEMVEKIVVEGVTNSYRIRDALNVAYYVDLMNAYNLIKPWPWAFTMAPKGFGMGKRAK